MDQAVTDYIDNIKVDWQANIAAQLRDLVMKTIPDAEERIQYGKPHYKKNGKYAAVIGTAKGWVSFTIFNAQTLTPPEGMFESSDTGDRRTIKITKDQDVDYDLVANLLKQASDTI